MAVPFSNSVYIHHVRLYFPLRSTVRKCVQAQAVAEAKDLDWFPSQDWYSAMSMHEMLKQRVQLVTIATTKCYHFKKIIDILNKKKEQIVLKFLAFKTNLLKPHTVMFVYIVQ